MLLFADTGGRPQFIIGGALVNLGYRMQDHLESFDFEHDENISPEQVWQEVLSRTRWRPAYAVRSPGPPHHPLLALVVCMDARIDTNELTGDTRKYYYIIRTAGSVLSEKEEEMLELAVENGVKVIVLTTHSDCAAEKAAASAETRKRFPSLAQAVDERELRTRELLAPPLIASRHRRGQTGRETHQHRHADGENAATLTAYTSAGGCARRMKVGRSRSWKCLDRVRELVGEPSACAQFLKKRSLKC